MISRCPKCKVKWTVSDKFPGRVKCNCGCKFKAKHQEYIEPETISHNLLYKYLFDGMGAK